MGEGFRLAFLPTFPCTINSKGTPDLKALEKPFPPPSPRLSGRQSSQLTSSKQPPGWEEEAAHVAHSNRKKKKKQKKTISVITAPGPRSLEGGGQPPLRVQEGHQGP